MSERMFCVIGREREEVVPILDDGTGPMEPVCDVWEGTAENRHEARRRAWQEWEKNWRSIVHENRWDGKHPMSGVKVVEYLPCPVHGGYMHHGECDCEAEDVNGLVVRWARECPPFAEAEP